MEPETSKWSDSEPVTGGQIPGGDGAAAFSLYDFDTSLLPLVLAVPHAGRNYPNSLLEHMRNPGPSGLRLEDRYVDRVARLAAQETGAALLVAHAPRAMIDLNRSPDDIDREMIRDGADFSAGGVSPGWRTRNGLGLIPRRLPGFGELWHAPLEQADVTARIADIHTPYHRTLGEVLARMRDRWGAALLLDIHSMPPLPARVSGAPAPLCVLGDRFGTSCDGGLAVTAHASLSEDGLIVAHNRPYAGGYVLDRHGNPRQGIHAMQIEFCRSLYLDSPQVEPSDGLPELGRSLARLVRRLADDVIRQGRAKRWDIAAE